MADDIEQLDHQVRLLREALCNAMMPLTEWDLRFAVGLPRGEFNKALQHGVETNKLERGWPNWVNIPEEPK